MSTVRTFALTTAASTVDLSAPFIYLEGPIGDDERIGAFLDHRDQHVAIWIESWPGDWKYLGDRQANISIDIDFELSSASEAERSAQQASVLAAFIQNEAIEAGTFEDIDLACFVYWNPSEVVVNSDPFVWESEVGRAIRRRLGDAGVGFEARVLDLYFDPSLSSKGGEDATGPVDQA